jgi:hypothetical protein
MQSFCETWFREMGDRSKHEEKQKDIATLKKAAHKELLKTAKYEKGKKFRIAAANGMPEINVICDRQPNHCAFNAKNIKDIIAPKIDWQAVWATGTSVEDQVNRLKTAIQTARVKYTPHLSLDIKPRKRKQFDMEQDSTVFKQTQKYRRLQQELKAMQARSLEFNLVKSQKKAIEEMKARGKTTKEVWSRAMNQMYVVRIVPHSKRNDLTVTIIKEELTALLSDPSTPRNATILARLLERIEKRLEYKTWEELVVQPKKDYEAAVRQQEQFQKQQQGGGVIGPDGHVYYPRQ